MSVPSWWIWCGDGGPPSPDPRTHERGRLSTPQGRTFAVFAPPDDGRPGQLQFATDGRRAVAFEGWLKNRRDLETRLEGNRDAVTDADLVLRLYAEKGDVALAVLLGRFAVAVWDTHGQRLVATRDPMGMHPLFVAEEGQSLVLSDSPPALLERPGVPGELNRPVLADFLRQRWPKREETFFRAVRRVPAGHTFIEEDGRRRLSETWRPPSLTEAGWATASELERFEELFSDAVAACLELGPAGIWLSGGLDSMSVAAFAARRCREQGYPSPLALCLRFPDPGVDEEPVQRRVADRLGFPLLMLGLEDAVGPKGVIGAALALAAEWPAPLMGPWQPAYLGLSRLGAEQGCRVILNGAGGDDWLGVSPYLAADLLAQGRGRELARLVYATSRSVRMPLRRLVRAYLWQYGARPLLGRRVLGTKAPALVERRDRRQLARSTPPWLAPDPSLRRQMDDRFEPTPPPRSFYEADVRKSLDDTLMAMEHEEFYEMGRRLRTPIVSPFWDAELVELLFRAPPDVLNRGGRTKSLVRELLDTQFPELALGRQRKVLATPTVRRLLSEEADRVWSELGEPSALAELGVVEPRAFADAVRDAGERGDSRTRWILFFQAASLELFARANL